MKEKIFHFNNKRLHIFERDDVDASIFNEIFKIGEYRRTVEVIKNAKHCIVDVGAHAGFFTLYARCYNPFVKLVSIEPELNNIQLLERHIEENEITNSLTLKGVLAGGSDGRLLKITTDSHNHHTVSKQDSKAVSDYKKVSSFTCADILVLSNDSKISLLKLDIEGGEYEVFESLAEKDFSSIEYIFMEYHNSKEKNYRNIERILREHGFGVEIFPSHFENSMGFIWARNKRV